MTREDTYDAHTNDESTVTSQIASVDAATGTDYVYHTSGDGCKISGQWVTSDVIGYDIKAGDNEGLAYNSSSSTSNLTSVLGTMRNPSWSADGKYVVYELPSFTPNRPMEKPLYSFDSEWDYR